jgi:hypothetical protein
VVVDSAEMRIVLQSCKVGSSAAGTLVRVFGVGKKGHGALLRVIMGGAVVNATSPVVALRVVDLLGVAHCGFRSWGSAFGMSL